MLTGQALVVSVVYPVLVIGLVPLLPVLAQLFPITRSVFGAGLEHEPSRVDMVGRSGSWGRG